MFENRFIIAYIVFDFFLNRISYCILTKLGEYANIHTEIELIHMSTKKVLIVILITFAAGTWVGNYISVKSLAWCDRIYHQSSSCPKYGSMVVPVAVLEKQNAKNLAWCDRIYHQNASCPKHGMKVPPIVLTKQEKGRLE